MRSKYYLCKISLLVFSGFMFSCSSTRTIFISNKLRKPIYIQLLSYYNANNIALKDSINHKSIDKKLVINFGNGKWSKLDESDLKNLLQQSTIIEKESKKQVYPKIQVRHISLNVEELWVVISN
ncbi:hypothetical protein [Cellulophaga sp. BC115SP]|uniref:hypothetical protein n=1 Tax=Cellulophaga sp. BC115SP TaxID=2683263 RepID=UPI001412F819|nr:hypothetical protein [Cellulophaga sp. BC115SP]NBB30984.1 hypothetical protein [Cellulophaga sp. BC115SP]